LIAQWPVRARLFTARWHSALPL